MEPPVTEQEAAKNPDKAVEDLMKEIQREQVPRRIIELAQALQAALDERDTKRR
ncbi:hypothetical protein [Shinella pollutisoli]|uniref:Uncharacterized protein n=1 Tax=Shinella pollutisoli TaxID=2250594 RepID=A0ABV7DET0_9HYPH|nr:hypothetical protein [Shinella pollutisoli]